MRCPGKKKSNSRDGIFAKYTRLTIKIAACII